jgi:hypothetical protein
VKNHDFTPKKSYFSNFRGGARNFCGISCEKSRFYAKKIIFFPILGGRAPGASPPWIRPWLVSRGGWRSQLPFYWLCVAKKNCICDPQMPNWQSTLQIQYCYSLHVHYVADHPILLSKRSIVLERGKFPVLYSKLWNVVVAILNFKWICKEPSTD